MCRIAGIIDPNQNPDQLAKDVKAMCDSMKHGGPDDEGFYYAPELNLQFGHRRLALIDLTTTGHQPMLFDNENLIITFNGEIYNYLALKSELSTKGIIFKTQSDTEVILAAYQVWGTESFKKLVGMFSFAISDKLKQLTYLVRDEIGIKPLYYSTNNGRLVFASEVKAFKQINYNYEENPDWKIYFLAFGHIPHPITTLKNVHSLASGHFLTWNHQQNTFQIISFKKEKEKHKTIFTEEEACIEMAQKLDDAVSSHLIADAQIGVFLSGGIDSSIITLLANKSLGEKLNTLSINFVEDAFSEEKFQKVISDCIEGKHSSYQITDQDFTASFNQIMMAMDQPTNDGINSWFVNKYAKRNGLKAVLSGIGADELFGGYPSFKRMKLIKKLKRLPRFLLKFTAFLPSEKLNRIYYLSYKNPIGEYLFFRGFFHPEAISKILCIPKTLINDLFEAFPIDESINDLKGEERASWLETNLYMKNQLLKDTDFMSMSHGVEVRVPFLDKNFVAATQQIPNQHRFKAQAKGLLIDAFKDILPETIWNRPKMGFTFPLQKWFLKSGVLITENPSSQNAYIEKLSKKFRTGKMHWSKAFALYQVTNNAAKH